MMRRVAQALVGWVIVTLGTAIGLCVWVWQLLEQFDNAQTDAWAGQQWLEFEEWLEADHEDERPC